MNVLRNLTISVTLYDKFAKLWSKKIHVQKCEKHRERNWQTSGKKLSIWVQDFAPMFSKYGANQDSQLAQVLINIDEEIYTIIFEELVQKNPWVFFLFWDCALCNLILNVTENITE